MSWAKSHPIIAALFGAWSLLILSLSFASWEGDTGATIAAFFFMVLAGGLVAWILTLVSNKTVRRSKRKPSVSGSPSATPQITRARTAAPIAHPQPHPAARTPELSRMEQDLEELKKRVAVNEEIASKVSWGQHYQSTPVQHRPSPKIVEQPRGGGITLKEVLRYTPTEFEEFCAKALNSMGYQDMKVNGGAGDLQADIVGKDSHGRSTIVQCKRYKPGTKIGTPVIQTFIGMMNVHHRADRGIFMTTADYSAPAIKLAQQHDIVLIDGDDLIKIAGLVFVPRPEARPKYQVRFCTNCGSEIESHEVRFCAECGQPIQREGVTIN